MQTRIRSRLILLSCVFLMLSGCDKLKDVLSDLSTITAFRVLPVTLFPQETSMWCWAASGQMVMAYLGNNVAQCTQADNRFNRTDCPCTQCTNPVSNPPCVIGGWPEFGKYGFTFQVTNNSALSWAQLTGEIDANRPIAFSWHWPGGGGHMMVASGYMTQDGIDYVWVLDPWSPCTGSSRWITYAVYVQQAGNHTHWNDYYDIVRQ